MKKIILLFTICLLLTGCSLFGKKPNDDPKPAENKVEDIGAKDNSAILTDSEQANKLLDDLNSFAQDNYQNDEFKKLLKDNKVSVKALRDSNKFDVSKIVEDCKDFCAIDQTYITVDYSNEESPISVDFDALVNSDPDYDIKLVLEYAKKAYDDKIYLNGNKKGDYYYLTLEELGNKYGYNISKTKCNKSTTIEFRPTEARNADDYPIFISGC